MTDGQRNGDLHALALLEAHRTSIESLCQKYGVTRLRIFGSSVRKDWNFESSDFDFLAEFEAPPHGVNLFRQLYGLIAELEALLGRHVDLLDSAAIRKPLLREMAESDAREWYAA